MYEGVQIRSEEEYPPEFANEPRLYGGVVISENEEAALKLPPKFGLFEDVSMVQCRIQLEEAVNKLRWNRIIDRNDTEEVNFYDATTKTEDINTMKVTSLPFNPGVKMPWALEESEEIKMAKFKGEVMTTLKQMKGKNRQWSNLKEEEKAGLESLKERMKEKELVCCVTDKSGRWSCDTMQNYKDACMEELRDEEKTPEITSVEHEGERDDGSEGGRRYIWREVEMDPFMG